jgi:hypothetical protein
VCVLCARVCMRDECESLILRTESRLLRAPVTVRTRRSAAGGGRLNAHRGGDNTERSRVTEFALYRYLAEDRGLTLRGDAGPPAPALRTSRRRN